LLILRGERKCINKKEPQLLLGFLLIYSRYGLAFKIQRLILSVFILMEFRHLAKSQFNLGQTAG
jgi:hypothetical protein